MLVGRICKRHLSGSKNDLATFLQQTGKDITSTTYRGTLFELQTLESFRTTTGMQLEHVGGKGDGGIDLRGRWLNNVNVVIQCKNTKQGCTPDHLRELMGTVLASASKRQKVIGILSTVSHRHFTADVLKHFNMSPVPLGLAQIENTTLKSLMFNKKAENLLKGVSISIEFDSQGRESISVELPSSTQF